MPKWHAMRRGKNTALQSSLIEAVLARDLPLVQQLMRRGASLSAKDHFGYTALSWAASEGCPEIIAVMLLNSVEPSEVAGDLLDALESCHNKDTQAMLTLFYGNASEETQREAFRLLKPKPLILSAVCDYMQEHFQINLQAVMLETRKRELSFGEKDTSCADSDSDWSKDESESSPPLALPPSVPLDLHVVTFCPSVAVRREPSARSPVLTGKKYGEVIELGEFDESGTWRIAYVDVQHSRTAGWVPVTHPLLGPLLAPQDALALPKVYRRGRARPWEPTNHKSLALAVQRHDLPAVVQLLRAGANANTEDVFGETSLFESVSNGDTGISAALLLYLADPCARSSSSGTCVAAFAPDDGTKALLRAFSCRSGADNEGERETDHEALRTVLATLPSDMLRPTCWTLRSRGVLRAEEEEAWLQADQARQHSLGLREGSPWAPRERAPNPPAAEPECLPPRLSEVPDPDLRSASCNLPDMYEVAVRPFVAVRTQPHGGVLCRAVYGQRLRLGDTDVSGEWRRCEVEEEVHGWILLRHPRLGLLVQRCRDQETEALGRPSRGRQPDTPDRAQHTPQRTPEASEATPGPREGDFRWHPSGTWGLETPIKTSRGKALGQRCSALEPLSSSEVECADQPCSGMPAKASSQPCGGLETPSPRQRCSDQELTALHNPCSDWLAAAIDKPCSRLEAEVHSHPHGCRMAETCQPDSPQQLGEIKVAELSHQPCSGCDAEGDSGVWRGRRAETPSSIWEGAAPEKPFMHIEAAASESSLVRAVRKQDLAEVLHCLQRGAEPNVRDALGETSLFVATSYGDVEVMAALLLHGADPQLKSYAGKHCWWYAEDIQSRTLLSIFSDWEVDPIARDDLLAALGPDLRSEVIEKLCLL